jgi:hypothetical protein
MLPEETKPVLRRERLNQADAGIYTLIVNKNPGAETSSVAIRSVLVTVVAP